MLNKKYKNNYKLIKNMKLELTNDEIKFLLEIINSVNFPGKNIESIYIIKEKIKQALLLEISKSDDKINK